MKKCCARLIRFLRDEGAESPVEMAAMLAFGILLIHTSVQELGGYASTTFQEAAAALVVKNQPPGSGR